MVPTPLRGRRRTGRRSGRPRFGAFAHVCRGNAPNGALTSAFPVRGSARRHSHTEGPRRSARSHALTREASIALGPRGTGAPQLDGAQRSEHVSRASSSARAAELRSLRDRRRGKRRGGRLRGERLEACDVRTERPTRGVAGRGWRVGRVTPRLPGRRVSAEAIGARGQETRATRALATSTAGLWP